MDATLRRYYPARSEVDLKEGVFYCAPQLDYDLFAKGDFSEQVAHCLDELSASERYLRKLLDEDEITALQAIFERMRVTG
ncbi:hypothetical protein C8D95_109139 [Silicimonas algicola]|uniref:Uncharacterized protein n=2 Tax=Silicimonas algicola TaxID=1826607 RepID=A0A316G293_9RHOB|nr:hypothetical protein C8D95_109139 [Silicimonas algicola]